MKNKENDLYKFVETHNWTKCHELNWCLDCGATMISLGIWGDENWRKTHNSWKYLCPRKVNK